MKWLNDLEQNQISITKNQQEIVDFIKQQHYRTRRMIIVTSRDENGLRYRFEGDEEPEQESPPEYSETDSVDS